MIFDNAGKLLILFVYLLSIYPTWKLCEEDDDSIVTMLLMILVAILPIINTIGLLMYISGLSIWKKKPSEIFKKKPKKSAYSAYSEEIKNTTRKTTHWFYSNKYIEHRDEIERFHSSLQKLNNSYSKALKSQFYSASTIGGFIDLFCISIDELLEADQSYTTFVRLRKKPQVTSQDILDLITPTQEAVNQQLGWINEQEAILAKQQRAYIEQLKEKQINIINSMKEGLK